MAIILQHLTTGNEYIFLGVSGGEGKPLLPKKMLGDFFSSEESDRSRAITVCDYQGRILWFPASEMVVIEVDGQKPDELLPEIAIAEPVPLQLDGENKNEKTESESNPDEFAEDDDWI
jgi:hypothetical protein